MSCKIAKPIDIFLVRHGEAAAGWNEERDPGLSPLGHRQAEQAADLLQSVLGTIPDDGLCLTSSPLARAQETATPLANRLAQSVAIESSVAELPSPDISLSERGPWLHGILNGRWADSGDTIQSWRSNIITYLQSLQQPHVIFTHFVVINAVLTYVTQDENVLGFYPDNGSVTHLQVKEGKFTLVSRGNESKTVIN